MAIEVVKLGVIQGGESFLILTEGKTAVVDTGFTIGAKGVVQNLRRALNGRPLDYILLTHSHYDHVSGASLIKKNWPDAKIVSGEHAAEVFEKPKVIRTMKKMNRAAAWQLKKKIFFNNDLSCLHTDIVVREGDVIDLGSVKFQVMESPGHTWDTLAFWCESESFLIGNETMGVFATAECVMPACLVSFKKTMEFLYRLDKLNPKNILVAHWQVANEQESRLYIDLAIKWHLYVRDEILKYYGEGKSVDEIKQLIKDEFYTDIIRKGQPEAAFDLNNKYLVPMIIKECGNE